MNNHMTQEYRLSGLAAAGRALLARIDAAFTASTAKVRAADASSAHRARTAGPKVPKSAAPAVAQIAAVDLALIRAEAIAAANKRVADVFASEASVGRERNAAVLLAGGAGMSAESIIRVLGMTPSADQATAASILASFARQPNPDLGGCGEADQTLNLQESWRRAHAAAVR
jgi:hypothetical protein